MLSPTTYDAASTTFSGHALLPTLQSVLNANIQQRDSILSLMKQLALGDLSATICTPMGNTSSEKSMLEAAHDREKELMREITDLNWRLACANDELQKYKAAENGRSNT